MPFWTRLDMNDDYLLDNFRQVDCKEIDTYDTMHDWLTGSITVLKFFTLICVATITILTISDTFGRNKSEP